MTANISDREIVSRRVLNFPRELVWKAWTDPRHLANWWGPKGFTNTFHAFNLKPGGIWSFVMHGPGGKDYKNESVFIEIVKPERIIFRHLKPVHEFQVTAAFVDHGDKTEVVFCMLFESAAECAQVKSYVPQANEQNFDKLEKELACIAAELKTNG